MGLIWYCLVYLKRYTVRHPMVPKTGANQRAPII
uniref:Uncharacterized protein n=1 Tax=Human herpesvirus 1 TaxID=10298 RepID=A0A2Z4HAK0_HHV1|nr:hypothetical protein [Human alphaherpesvirus 1]